MLEIGRAMLKNSLIAICIGYLLFIVLMSFGVFQKVSFLMFGDKWWQYTIDAIQAVGSLATAGTLIWVIHTSKKEKKEAEIERKQKAFSLIMADLIDLCEANNLQKTFKINYALHQLETEFVGDVRDTQIHDQLEPLRVHIRQTYKKLTVEYLIGLEKGTEQFPTDIYENKLVDEITVPDFKKRVQEVAYLITKNKKFSLVPIGNINFVNFDTLIDVGMLNKLTILAQPICINYLEESAGISWQQQNLKNLGLIIKGIDVAAYIYVLNHENGKALVEEFGENHGQ
jgi:hypothetical protein